MLAPEHTIPAPGLPRELTWINVATLRMDQQKGRPVLVEFWDCARANCLRTAPYLQAWHERYAEAGLRVIAVHAGAYPISQREDTVRATVERLGLTYAVAIDKDWRLWHDYGNKGWPARYLWTPDQWLHSYHYGEGAYGETEAEIRHLLGLDSAATAPPLRPEDAPDANVGPVTEEKPGAYSGPYAAGSVWAVVSGSGTVTANETTVTVSEPGCVELLRHSHHTESVLNLTVEPGVTVYAVQFVPGVLPLP